MSRSLVFLFVVLSFSAIFITAQTQNPPPAAPGQIPQAQPLSQMSPEELEQRGDQLRAEKAFADSVGFYKAALAKNPRSAVLPNKIGISELQMLHYDEAATWFDRAIKADRKYADAYNNRAVVYYVQKKYGKAIKLYRKSLKLREGWAPTHRNLGTAYFARKQYDKAVAEYQRAVQLDPGVFDDTRQGGVTLEMIGPQERGRYAYTLARLFAMHGDRDRALLYLKRAIDQGYDKVQDIYKDDAFAAVRKDPRFSELMAKTAAAPPY